MLIFLYQFISEDIMHCVKPTKRKGKGKAEKVKIYSLKIDAFQIIYNAISKKICLHLTEPNGFSVTSFVSIEAMDLIYVLRFKLTVET